MLSLSLPLELACRAEMWAPGRLVRVSRFSGGRTREATTLMNILAKIDDETHNLGSFIYRLRRTMAGIDFANGTGKRTWCIK